MTVSQERVIVALVRRAHALEGELFVHLETDYPEEVFRRGRVLRVSDGGPIGLSGRLTVEEARPHGDGWILRLEEIEDRTLAESYAGHQLSLNREDLVALGEDEYFLHDLPGMEVRDEQGRALGTVEDVYDTAAAPVLEVTHDGEEGLVPCVREIVIDIDTEARVITLRPPAGLLEI